MARPSNAGAADSPDARSADPFVGRPPRRRNTRRLIMAEGFYVLSDEERRKFAKIVAKVWTDGPFADRYEAEPMVVLGEYGIDYPQGFPAPLVPAKPAGDLSLESLESVAAGSESEGTTSSVSTISCPVGTSFCIACYSDA